MKSDPIYRERLLYLADHLDVMPPERFNFAYFVGRDWKGKPDLSCGTTACGLGLATTLPLFRELGLVLKSRPISNDCFFGYPALNYDCPCNSCKDNRGDREMSAEINRATEAIFGIDVHETDFLFMPKENQLMDDYSEDEWAKLLDKGATAKELSAHIRKFVEMNS